MASMAYVILPWPAMECRCLSKDSPSHETKFRRNTFGSPARRLVLPLVAAAVLAPASHATVSSWTTNGRWKVIQSQNDFYININVSGTLVPVPRKRIKEFVIQKPNENVRLLLDKANEAIRRNETSIARRRWSRPARSTPTTRSCARKSARPTARCIDLERSGAPPRNAAGAPRPVARGQRGLHPSRRRRQRQMIEACGPTRPTSPPTSLSTSA